MQHRRDHLGLRGEQHVLRDRQRQHALPHRHVRNEVVDQVRCGLRHTPRAARRAEPAALAAERRQLVVPALAAPQPQEAVHQDAALEEDVELAPDEARQFGVGAGLGAGDEAGRMLLHQAIQRGLLGAVSFVVDQGPSGARWGCRPMACTRGSRSGEHARCQAARRPSIAQWAAY